MPKYSIEEPIDKVEIAPSGQPDTFPAKALMIGPMGIAMPKSGVDPLLAVKSLDHTSRYCLGVLRVIFWWCWSRGIGS